MSRAPATFVRKNHRKWFSFFFCKTILSVAWICAWFGSAGYFTILADYFKICGEHCNQLLDCFSVLHMSPHAGKGNKHLSHWINSGKREGRGGENYLDDELSLQIINTESSCSKHIQECLIEEHMEFQCTYAKNYWLLETLMLFVVIDFVKLHLTAFNELLII